MKFKIPDLPLDRFTNFIKKEVTLQYGNDTAILLVYPFWSKCTIVECFSIETEKKLGIEPGEELDGRRYYNLCQWIAAALGESRPPTLDISEIPPMTE